MVNKGQIISTTGLQEIFGRLCDTYNYIHKKAALTFDSFKKGNTVGVNLVYKEEVIMTKSITSDEDPKKMENIAFETMLMDLMCKGVDTLIKEK
jgi:hypothetical protein